VILRRLVGIVLFGYLVAGPSTTSFAYFEHVKLGVPWLSGFFACDDMETARSLRDLSTKFVNAPPSLSRLLSSGCLVSAMTVTPRREIKSLRGGTGWNYVYDETGQRTCTLADGRRVKCRFVTPQHVRFYWADVEYEDFDAAGKTTGKILRRTMIVMMKETDISWQASLAEANKKRAPPTR